MIKSEDILSGLQAIVNDYQAVAIIWHALFYILIAALFLKWEPSNRTIAILMSLPLVSVAVFAWMTGNPFNGSLFSIASILLIIFGIKANTQPIVFSQTIFMVAGMVMIIFGLVYPHFIRADKIYEYLYASPAGLIPCPTLSIIIGFLLVFNGFGSHSITLTLIVMGLFYGLFGVFRLAVYLDIFLIAGTVTLILKYILSLKTA